jgi:ATP-dependent protease HslVU (ClpYQ) peptidase subunit
MTCIVGVVDKDGVYIGGDSAVTIGYMVSLSPQGKVFRCGNMVFGASGSIRTMQLIQYSFTPRSWDPTEDVMTYLTTHVIPGIRETLKTGGNAIKEMEQERSSGLFMIGLASRLFLLHSDYSLTESVDGMLAAGCGLEVAYGALYATQKKKPRERITTALEAAVRYCNSVRPPFTIDYA